MLVAAIGWAVWDAWRPRLGALHYAAGEWVLAQGDVENQGTIRVALDLQSYILVRFLPSRPPLASPQQLKVKAQWLHLESAYGQDWHALRRALYAAPSNPVATLPSATPPGLVAAGASVSAAIPVSPV